MDDTTRTILTLLQADARISNAEIGRRVGLTPTAVLERLRKLQRDGVVRGFTALLERRRVGYGVTAFISIQTSASLQSADIAARLGQIPEVMEIHDVAGTDCFLLKVVARDIDDLHSLIHERVSTIEAVTSTSTTIVMKTFKETPTVPVEDPHAEVPSGTGSST